MGKVENYTQQAENIARDDTHGYDQNDRWGNPNFDCSGLVITVVQNSGIPVKSNGATYTGNMLTPFKKCGFKDVKSSVNLATGNGLKRGDVLLNRNHHTVIYCGNGLVVGARINEKGGVVGGQSGDQTGNEISIHGYYNYPWTNILRYEESGTSQPTSSLDEIAKQVIQGKFGNNPERAERLEQLGYVPQQVQKRVNELLGYGGSPTKDYTEIARKVIRGNYGNGQTRIQRLKAEGFSSSEIKQIQSLVNQML